MADIKTTDTKKAISTFFNLIKSETKSISSIYVLAILSGIISLSLPLGIQSIINFTQGGRLSSSWILLIAAITLGILFSGYLNIFQIEIIEKIQQRIFVKSGFNFTLKLASLNKNLAANKNPDKVSNLFFETVNLQKGIYKLLSEIISSVVQLIFGILLLSLYSSAFLIFGLFMFFLLFLIIRFSTSKGLTTSLNESNEKNNMAAWIQQIGRNYSIFNSVAKTSHLFNNTDTILNKYIIQRTNHFNILKFQYWNIIAFKAIITATLLIIGSILVVDGQINIGQFVASEIIVILVINSAEKIIFSMDSIYDLLTASVKLSKIEDLNSELDGISKFDFNELFESDCLIINNLLAKDEVFTIYRGVLIEMESTNELVYSLKQLVNYKPQGKIKINSIPISTINVSSLRNNIALGGFNQNLINGNLLENITLQNKIEDIPLIYNLASQLGFDYLIDELPDGIETVLNDNTLENPIELAFVIEVLRKLYFMPKLLVINVPNFINKEQKIKLTEGLKKIYSTNFLIILNNV